MHKKDGNLSGNRNSLFFFFVTRIALLQINKLIHSYNKEGVLHFLCQSRVSLSLRYHIKATLLPIPVCSIFSKLSRQVCSCWRVFLLTNNKMAVVAMEISVHRSYKEVFMMPRSYRCCESSSVSKNQK